MFNCSADGIPPPSLIWYKGENILLNSSRYMIHEQESMGFRLAIPQTQQTSSSLTILRIRAKDSGYYECRADNSAGETKIVTHHLNITDSML